MQHRMSRATLFLVLILVPLRWVSGQTTQGTHTEPAKVDFVAPVPETRSARWLDLQAGTLGFRYKDTELPDGPWFYQLQYQFLTRGRLKFDKNGRFYAGFRVSTGTMFKWSWNDFRAGGAALETEVYLKDLFFSASPWKGIEIQYGGIGITRGESTEITSYSNNGYVTGERVSIHRPDKLFFDELSATGAYLGDQFEPGIFQRMHRLGSMNYHQFMAVKKVKKHAFLSADYTFENGVETLRQACRIMLPKNPLADSLVFENYERLDYLPAWGYALTMQKSPIPRLVLSGGLVSIDPEYIAWNADRMGKGSRIYINANFRLWRELSAVIYATKAYGDMTGVTTAARYDLIVTYDFMKALKRAHAL